MNKKLHRHPEDAEFNNDIYRWMYKEKKRIKKKMQQWH